MQICSCFKRSVEAYLILLLFYTNLKDTETNNIFVQQITKTIKDPFLKKCNTNATFYISSSLTLQDLTICQFATVSFDSRKNNRTAPRRTHSPRDNWLRCSCILGVSLYARPNGARAWFFFDRYIYFIFFVLYPPLVLNYIRLLSCLVIVNGTMSNTALVFILFSFDVALSGEITCGSILQSLR